MTERFTDNKPYPVQAAVELDITCTIGRQSHLFRVDFRRQGDLKTVAIPPLAEHPARRHRLWENTCLECFVAAETSSAYWELNLSPSGQRCRRNDHSTDVGFDPQEHEDSMKYF